MNNHQSLLEELTLASHKNTELLIELSFQMQKGIPDEALIKSLTEISKSLNLMQATVNAQLRAAKHHH